jgi:hypothetical protein
MIGKAFAEWPGAENSTSAYCLSQVARTEGVKVRWAALNHKEFSLIIFVLFCG